MPQLRGPVKAVPREYITNALPVDDGWGILWSPVVRCMQDALKEFLVGEAKGGLAMVEPLMEEEED